MLFKGVIRMSEIIRSAVGYASLHPPYTGYFIFGEIPYTQNPF
ncbi:Uncharacterized protein dnm_033560 [Desulfonema magnum]|uniref:Uncharacterized protein n=1 Tax=Desulfonema magnum TaxID=45655 RepID=A0A975GMV1_9BACT|nr:Uncharacterized protein dnm_033560 [Desulfonema magnum]